MICCKYIGIHIFVTVVLLGILFPPGNVLASSEVKKEIMQPFSSMKSFPSGNIWASPENAAKYSDILSEVGNYSCLSPSETELVQLINNYRQSKGLPSIANSRSLTKVARIHVLDLSRNSPAMGHDSRGLDCSLHSWSGYGFWTPVCYTHDHYYAEELWNKPREITHGIYFRVGYENAYWTSASEVNPSRVLESWKKNPDHNALILETGKWRKTRLVALGVGIYKNYAVIWVGTMLDPLGSLKSCKGINE